MQEESPLLFGAFRVDTTNGCLWHGQQALVLTPKAFAVLRYLVEHPDQLVTKEDLFQAVWPGTYVSDAALTVCIREIRKVLADNPRAPRYIETVHRRGYRFIGKVTSSQYSVVGRETPESGRQAAAARSFSFPPQPSALSPQPSVLIGREAELRQLHGWLKKAQAGERQLVFVTGEPGVGKTALVEAFLQHVAAPQGAWACLGQCIEHFGVGEAYLPILAALGQVCREPGGQRLLEILIQHAPTWLVQMPALFNADEYEVLQQKTTGATRERMLREMAEALEALTAERPLVLVLEDLHWSDASTLALLGFLARRHQPAQLLVIGTYRPTEVIVREHPLKTVKQELQIHERCAEIPLQFLTEENVNEYLERRCPEGVSQPALFRRLADVIYQRTDGNPLFMVTLVEDLVTRGLLVCGESGWELRGEAGAIATGVPESLRQMVEEQVARLSGEDRHVLEVRRV